MDRTTDAPDERDTHDSQPAPVAPASCEDASAPEEIGAATTSPSASSASSAASPTLSTSVPTVSSVAESSSPSADSARSPQSPSPTSTARRFLARARTLYVRITDRYPFPKLPPAPRGNRIALGAVALLALAFVVYFVAFTWAKHDAYQTFAEDMGIMDQALWNLMHGYGLRQTICNPVGDANCLGDVSRLAIHFEPIMYVIGLLYLVAPSPKTLQLLQAVVVATGAFPAYGIASRRLRSALAGVAFATVYLLFPALQAAVTYDFHAVTLSAAFLMFALYFMLTRNNVGLVVACVLAMSTKENIPVDVLMIGASVAILQRRPRIGLALCVVALLWLGIELPIMHAASPVGYSPTAGRYSYLGSSPLKAGVYLLTHPLQIIREHVLDPGGRFYLRALLSPTAYLALLGPFALLMAVPAIAVNILSTFPSQRTGLYHYNAEIVPFLVFATIEAVAWIAALAAWIAGRAEGSRMRAAIVAPAARVQQAYGRAVRALPLVSHLAPSSQDMTRVSLPRAARWLATMLLVALTLLFSLHEQTTRGYLPFSQGFSWPEQTAHTRLAERFLQMIPARASVSAQSELAPHLSQRRFIYQFPFADTSSDYVFLDITGSPYPFFSTGDYFTAVRKVLTSGRYTVVAAQDGYLLLRRGSGPSLNPSNPYGLPESLFSFSEQPNTVPVPHPMQAQLGSSLRLVGYDITPSTHPIAQTTITVTTYWQVAGPAVGAQDQLQLLVTRANGTYSAFSDFAATALQPLSDWRPGVTYAVQAQVYITPNEAGSDLLSVRVRSGQGQSSVDFLPALLPALGAPGALPAPNADRTQIIFAVITV